MNPVSDWGLMRCAGESNRTVRREDRAIGREPHGVSRETAQVQSAKEMSVLGCSGAYPEPVR